MTLHHCRALLVPAATFVPLAIGWLFRRSRRPKRYHSAGGRRAGARAGQTADHPRTSGPHCATVLPRCARGARIVISRFEQGTDVEAGDVLYRLDPAPFEVECAPRGGTREGQAVFEQETAEPRGRGAAPTRAVSQSQFERRVRQGASGRGRSSGAQSRCRARQAQSRPHRDPRTDQRPHRPRAVTEGALVGQGEATHLATIQQLSPVYADFTQSVTEMHQLRRAFESGDLGGRGPSRQGASGSR